MNIDMTLTFCFEIKDAELYGGPGSIGYSCCSMQHCDAEKAVAVLSNPGKTAELEQAQINSVAKLIGIAPECVRLIPYEEYAEKTEDLPPMLKAALCEMVQYWESLPDSTDTKA